MIPKPIALGMTIREKVIVEERTKNVTLVSCFTRLIVEDFPSPPQRFTLFAALKGGLGNGIMEVVGTRLDTDETIYVRQVLIQFPNRLMEVRFIFRVTDCSFPEVGIYHFTLLIDGEWLAQHELHVVGRREQP
jgi:hypothetical protein